MRLGRLKHYIKLYMPYKWVLEYEEKRDFFAQYFAWKETNPHVEFDTESKWENIVSIEGFGYSGSGAVVDLLREYDDCLVHGMAEGGSKAVVGDDDLGEIELIQYPGGLIDIDGTIGTNMRAVGDHALKRFGKMISHQTIYRLGVKYREFVYLFFDSLLWDIIRDTKESSSILMPRVHDDRLTMRNMTHDEYYDLCQRFLYSLFNLQYNGKSKYLVLDQLVSAANSGVEYCRKFIPNVKSIVIWRDPRDIYTIAKRQDIRWLGCDSVEHFIKVIGRRYANLDIPSKDYLSIRFEDLILDYDTTVASIEKYLNLGEHKRPQSCLDISISCKNIGTWKDTTDIPQEDYQKIFNELVRYCYNP